jgi:hypothetical protein
MKIRIVTTRSKAKAVQIVRYQNYKRVVLRHIGSAHSQEALDELLLLAEEWIKDYKNQLSIFPDEHPNNLLHLNHSTFVGVKYGFFSRQIYAIQDSIGLGSLPALLNDLVAIRIFEPASKFRSLELLEQFFGIKHSRKTYYKIAPNCIEFKEMVQQKVIAFAKACYAFNYDLLFYDVTTLYFETFEEDGLRRNGFSKDNKSQQPQILIALMVSKEGFPVAYDIFPGNTFEGHTFIPFVKAFIEKNRVKDFTIVADAAMISSENIKQLIQNRINYIVAARLGNLSGTQLDIICNTLQREDGKSIRIKHEMEKQI